MVMIEQAIQHQPEEVTGYKKDEDPVIERAKKLSKIVNSYTTKVGPQELMASFLSVGQAIVDEVDGEGRIDTHKLWTRYGILQAAAMESKLFAHRTHNPDKLWYGEVEDSIRDFRNRLMNPVGMIRDKMRQVKNEELEKNTPDPSRLLG
jgi:hypothetical protein